MKSRLDNVFWHALTGPQACFAEGQGEARRFARGFSPIVAFAEPETPDFDDLNAHCEPGERFYCSGWAGPAPSGWQIEAETTMFRMVWSAARPHGETAGLPLEGGQAEPAAQGFGLDSLEPAAQPLGPNHVEQMLALTALTQPGPFGPRTIELGDYIGAFEGERLIAMAGERAEAGPYREISGVCTHPDAQGRGWARRLMQILIARQRQRGQTPFLHVMRENTLARQLYRRMGFRDHCETVVRVIARS